MGQKILLALFFILCIWNTIERQCNRIISNCCWGWEPDRVSELSCHLEEQIAPSQSFSHYRGSNYTDRQCGSEISIWWNNIFLVLWCNVRSDVLTLKLTIFFLSSLRSPSFSQPRPDTVLPAISLSLVSSEPSVVQPLLHLDSVLFTVEW